MIYLDRVHEEIMVLNLSLSPLQCHSREPQDDRNPKKGSSFLSGKKYNLLMIQQWGQKREEIRVSVVIPFKTRIWFSFGPLSTKGNTWFVFFCCANSGCLFGVGFGVGFSLQLTIASFSASVCFFRVGFEMGLCYNLACCLSIF